MQPNPLPPARDAMLQVSDNGRYFVRDGAPFFWMGDTVWSIVNQYAADEAEEYLEHRRRQGFTVVHIMVLFDGGPRLVTPAADARNELPFIDMNPATPNEAYFANVDRIVRLTREKGFILVILPLGGSSGSFVHKKAIITRENARPYGSWLGRRYRDEPHIVWSNGFDLKPWMYEEIAYEFAAGLQEGDAPGRLITYHPCGNATSAYFHHQPWLAANFIQTWADYLRIHPMVHHDYLRTPAKPVVHVEGAYEAGSEYPTGPITPLLVRQQAYWAYLSGGFHTYGHNDMWRHNPTWRASLDAPGAQQMGVLKQIFTGREWWKLIPDQSIFALGAGGDKALNVAARSSDGDFVMVYLSNPTTVALHMNKITTAPTARARWVDPETGSETSIGDFPTTGTHSFTTPEGRPDAVLLLDAE
jgi:Protein of unknown function (DUF4038)/Putative collagen-binding domain of a collagenase